MRVIRRCLIFLVAVATMWALQNFESFLVPTLIGLFLALVLTPIVHALERRGVPAGIAAAGIVVTMLLSLGAVIYAVLPGYEDYTRRAPEIVREIERKLAPLRESAVEAGILKEGEGGTEEALEGDEQGTPKIAPVPSNDGKSENGEEAEMVPTPTREFYTDIALEAPTLFGNFLYIVFLTFFTIYDRRRLMRAALMTQSNFGARAWLARVIREMRTKVARYLLTITIINTGLGICTGLVFWGIGMPSPLLWGVGMATLNFIPYLGPAIMNVIVFAVAFVSFPTVGMALVPVAALLMLNMIEGQIVTPMVVGSRVLSGTLPVFVAVAFGAWLWGAAGALLATPALIVGQTLMSARRSARRPLRYRDISDVLEGGKA